MTDRHADIRPLESAWLAFGRVAAVTAGALVALVSLLFHLHVQVATFRGALAFLGVWLVVRAGAWALPLVRGARAATARAAIKPEPIATVRKEARR
jgi:hypothetical protein